MISKSQRSNTYANLEMSDHHHLSHGSMLPYESYLVRQMSSFANFGISFSLISVPTGVSIMFAYGINTGGPSIMLATCAVVPFFTIFVALSLAEICSTYPTAGGVYHWAFQLAPDGHKAWWAWITAWFNILGMVAGCASVDFGLAINFMALINLCTGCEVTAPRVIGIYIMFLFLHCLINFMPMAYISFFNHMSVWIHVITLVVIFTSVLSMTPHHNTTEWGFVNNTGNSGAYCSFISSLFAAFIFTGYEASATMAEETQDAHINAPKGIVTAVLASYPACIIFVLGLLFSIPNLQNLLDSPAPFAQLLVETTTRGGAACLLSLILLCNFCCGLGAVTSSSRVVFAFARDGGLPFSEQLLCVTEEGVPFFSVLSVVVVGAHTPTPHTTHHTQHATRNTPRFDNDTNIFAWLNIAC